MASGEGISGTAVTLAAVGGVLAYAGFRDVNPIQALRDISSGKPPKVPSKDAGLDESDGGGGARQAGYGGDSAVVSAAMKYRGDQYSQGLRGRSGYSDCSSFISKAYEDVGVDAPTPNTTMGYLSSPRWRTIPVSSARAGDIVVSRAHMVLVTGPGKAIGQQNPADDVKTGSIRNLMTGTGSYVARRYTGGGGDGTVAI